MRARRVGSYKGRPVYRVPVTVDGGPVLTVTASSAADAANLVAAEICASMTAEGCAPFDVVAVGPNGGLVTRYRTWDGAIFAAMMNNSDLVAAGQMDLFAQNPARSS